MPMPFSYSNCRIVIYDVESNVTVADTVILNSDKGSDLISVSRSAFVAEPPIRVSVLIFTDQFLVEYLGTVRKGNTASGRVELALYKGKNREGRGAKRYTVNSAAKVESLVIGGKSVPLRSSLEVLVVNMSATGCLIRGGASIINVGSTFQLTLALQNTVTTINTTVLRIHRLDAQTVEYGCKFRFS